jgi:carbon monoxide dehydrogenase subunit G
MPSASANGEVLVLESLVKVSPRRDAIVARRQISAPAESVIRFLADLEHHARLAPGSVQVLRVSRPAGRRARTLVRLTGPLGMKRTASTELLQTRPANSIAGQARIGKRTVASVAWCVEQNDGGSFVTLRATVDAAGPIDRVVLLLGGHRWLARRFDAALERLSDLLAATPSRSSEELTARAA